MKTYALNVVGQQAVTEQIKAVGKPALAPAQWFSCAEEAALKGEKSFMLGSIENASHYYGGEHTPINIEPAWFDEGDDGFKQYVVERDGESDIEFTGELIAAVNDKGVYSDGGRWNVYKLWKTKAGRYVCQSIGRTSWQGETDRYKAHITPLTDKWVEEVTGFFGFGALAKELYAEAEIDATYKVE